MDRVMGVVYLSWAVSSEVADGFVYWDSLIIHDNEPAVESKGVSPVDRFYFELCRTSSSSLPFHPYWGTANFYAQCYVRTSRAVNSELSLPNDHFLHIYICVWITKRLSTAGFRTYNPQLVLAESLRVYRYDSLGHITSAGYFDRMKFISWQLGLWRVVKAWIERTEPEQYGMQL